MARDIWKHIEVRGPDECWPWTGSTTGRGRATYKTREKSTTPYRLVYEERYGPIPPGWVVRHKCDNQICCSPYHLEIGTYSDNLRDAYARNRRKDGMRLSIPRGVKGGGGLVLNVIGPPCAGKTTLLSSCSLRVFAIDDYRSARHGDQVNAWRSLTHDALLCRDIVAIESSGLSVAVPQLSKILQSLGRPMMTVYVTADRQDLLNRLSERGSKLSNNWSWGSYEDLIDACLKRIPEQYLHRVEINTSKPFSSELFSALVEKVTGDR